MARLRSNTLSFRSRRRRSLLGGAGLPIGLLMLAAIVAWQSGAFDRLRAEFETNSALAPAAEAPDHAGLISGRTASIVDGDGLILSTGEEIRLGDFNAPEWNQPGGAEAKEALSEIAYGEDIICTPCEGARNPKRCTSYDRIVATCRLNGKRLGDLMRARGIAEGGR